MGVGTNQKYSVDTNTVSRGKAHFCPPYHSSIKSNIPIRSGPSLSNMFGTGLFHRTRQSSTIHRCINVQAFPGVMQSTAHSHRPKIESTGNDMEHSWNSDITWVGGPATERRGEKSNTSGLPRRPKSSTMAAHLTPLEIEEEILQSPDLQHHHAAVVLYLQLDIWLLESIFALRNSDSAALAQLHPSLFEAPPDGLFHLIYTLRHFPNLDLSSTIEKVESLHRSNRGKDRGRESGSGSRVAPRGQAYGCPSKHCKKAFIKSGHAVNHVEKQHPEYLKLHPDYQPSHFMVDHPRSRPTSPELERQERARATNRAHEARPSSGLIRTPSAASESVSLYYSDGTGGTGTAWDRPSPLLHGYESQGDSDELSQLVPSGNISRTTNYPSPSYSGTGQDVRGHGSPDLSRYLVPVNHSKRAREHSSSSESVATVCRMDENENTRFRRHYAKRRSTFEAS